MGEDGPDCVSQLRQRAHQIERAPVTQILPFLYVGNQHDAKDLVGLKVSACAAAQPGASRALHWLAARPAAQRRAPRACTADVWK